MGRVKVTERRKEQGQFGYNRVRQVNLYILK